MQIVGNKLFDKFVVRHGISLDDALTHATHPLPVVQSGDYFLLKPVPKRIDMVKLFDETGVECFLNHEHLPARSRKQVLSVLARASALRASMESHYKETSFRIIISFRAREATLRFHKLRPNEDWLNIDDLNGFLQEAVVVISVGPEALTPTSSMRVSSLMGEFIKQVNTVIADPKLAEVR